ncbi:conserved Plasmodium protein, unknown function [Plasmodium berghei]|uniref:Uncharacterized protein n=2 Tax=Plasmodium berghei TaxID=5821 RepID=A0A509AJ76_PLABA|nr:conserved Plasmodium protein, unknown function [Plasmodium berghei ANKA]CXI46818.1 conserved Plasmodium protein, unknown function [Plasmodium berghei]SCM22830.1 conserved Plasmodium protein, unknown function [Plasmodium berghei]SCN25726.1 conserved Plasmodium protein, unknown function [Plasmodium berghei]SCO60640.1 conserved Plasmodium protein, unknown function [Plasmodium berghei]SCO62361.1 conserved Plasmodium protein, unknown function [Plasmodium berghei]|eukprot:XP_034421778.1 conserved Plasmodium protein, unknown function [Plasmodium berghei ANKA]
MEELKKEVNDKFQEPKLNNFEKTFMDNWINALDRVDEGRRCFENLRKIFQEMIRIEKEYEHNLSNLCNIFNEFENESSGIKNGIIGIKKNIERRCEQIKEFVNYVEIEIINNTLNSTLDNHKHVFNYIKLDGIENNKMDERAKNESLKYIERCAYSYESLVNSINVFHNSFYYDPIKRIELSNNCIKQYLIAKKREEEYKNAINDINNVQEKKEKRLKNILSSLESMDYKRIACLKDNVMKYLIFLMSYIRNVQYDVNLCIDIFKDIDPYKEIEEYCLKKKELNKKQNEQLIFYNNIVSWPMLIDFVDEINEFSRKNYKTSLYDNDIDDKLSDLPSKNKYSNILLSFFNMNTYKKWVIADGCTPLGSGKTYNSDNEYCDKSIEENENNSSIISTGIFNDIVFFKKNGKGSDRGEMDKKINEEKIEGKEQGNELGEKYNQEISDKDNKIKDELKDDEKTDAQNSKINYETDSNNDIEKELNYLNIKKLFQSSNKNGDSMGNNNKYDDDYSCNSNYDLTNRSNSLKNIRLFFIFYLKNIFASNFDVLSEFNIGPFFNSYNNRLIFCECLMRFIKEDISKKGVEEKKVSNIKSMVIFTKVILLFLDACNEYYDYWSAMYILVASENLYLEVDANENINVNILLKKYSFEKSNEISYSIENKGNDNSDFTFENIKSNLNSDIDGNNIKKEDEMDNKDCKNMINIFENNKSDTGIEMRGRVKTNLETESVKTVDEKKKVYLYRFLYEHGLWNDIKFWETCLLIIISEIIQESILLEKLRYENKESLIKNYFFFFKYFKVYNTMINYGLSVNQIGLLLNKIFRLFNLKTDPTSRKHFFQIIDIATNKNITLNYIKMGPENMNNEYKKYYMQYYNNFLNDDSRNDERKN